MAYNMATIHDYLRYTVEMKGSDLHIRPGAPPYVRVNGHLHKTDFPVLSEADTERSAMELMNDEEAARFKETGDLDFAYSERGLGRFRVNIFRQR
ncbi:MAG TPA: type IV pili twitching motility protein PilT, partial [Actinomycetota bacterium]|nr:type IV pili twitching motility protein PilT [Actinomycetota bacterium]